MACCCCCLNAAKVIATILQLDLAVLVLTVRLPWLVQYDAASDTVTTETLSILAQKQRTQFTPKHVAYPETFRPQSTFAVNGKVFYIDPSTFPDQTLLERLTPPDPAAPTQPPQEGKDITT